MTSAVQDLSDAQVIDGHGRSVCVCECGDIFAGHAHMYRPLRLSNNCRSVIGGEQ